MTRLRFRASLVLLALVAALVAYAATATARTSSPAAAPIVIGWAFDSKGAMAPFDNPALAAAQLRVKQWNAKGGVNGRKLQIRTCDTQGNKAAIAKACALKLLGQGASIIFTTCDVDLAAPVVQEAINRGVLAVAPCIGTDQMGPKRFGAKGRLAFSYGNVYANADSYSIGCLPTYNRLLEKSSQCLASEYSDAGQPDIYQDGIAKHIEQSGCRRRQYDPGRSIDRRQAQHRRRLRPDAGQQHNHSCRQPACHVQWQAALPCQTILRHRPDDGQRRQNA